MLYQKRGRTLAHVFRDFTKGPLFPLHTKKRSTVATPNNLERVGPATLLDYPPLEGGTAFDPFASDSYPDNAAATAPLMGSLDNSSTATLVPCRDTQGSATSLDHDHHLFQPTDDWTPPPPPPPSPVEDWMPLPLPPSSPIYRLLSPGHMTPVGPRSFPERLPNYSPFLLAQVTNEQMPWGSFFYYINNRLDMKLTVGAVLRMKGALTGDWIVEERVYTRDEYALVRMTERTRFFVALVAMRAIDIDFGSTWNVVDRFCYALTSRSADAQTTINNDDIADPVLPFPDRYATPAELFSPPIRIGKQTEVVTDAVASTAAVPPVASTSAVTFPTLSTILEWGEVVSPAMYANHFPSN